MDEEVQKWSKKDLQGIKDAMQYPGRLWSGRKKKNEFACFWVIYDHIFIGKVTVK